MDGGASYYVKADGGMVAVAYQVGPRQLAVQLDKPAMATPPAKGQTETVGRFKASVYTQPKEPSDTLPPTSEVTWQDGGVTVRVRGDLPAAELLKVARSMYAAEPAAGESKQLLIEEHAVVAKGVDTPEHFEYTQRIDPAILEKRQELRSPSPAARVARTNETLARFGYRLQPKEKPGCPVCVRYDLYRGDEVVQANLGFVRMITVNEKGDDFALGVEDEMGRGFLVRAGGITAWNVMQHAFTAPVFAGNRLVTLEADEQHRRFTVRHGDETLYLFEAARMRVDEPVKGLWSFQGQWVLEADGEVVIDGKSLNEQLGYEEAFGWRLLNDQPFYFFKKAGKIGLSYGSEVLSAQYDEVIHYRCCEPAAFNVQGNDQMVWFHALRDGQWYYVEAVTVS
jgi:hypothetical protein